MKKKIAIITLIPSSGWFYAEQVQLLFGDLAEVKAYSTGDMSVERIELSDIRRGGGREPGYAGKASQCAPGSFFFEENIVYSLY